MLFMRHFGLLFAAAMALVIVSSPASAQTGRIAGCVWHDQNHNGIQDPGEFPANPTPGLRVELMQTGVAAPPLDSEVLAAGGCYAFTALTPGSYFVRMLDVKGHHARSESHSTRWHSPKDGGNNDLVDSDFEGPGVGAVAPEHQRYPQTDPIVFLVGNEQFENVDMGYRWGHVVGDRVFWDDNRNGRQDAGEPGAAGLTVQLWEPSTPRLFYETSTGENGAYMMGAPRALGDMINTVASGQHYLEFLLPPGIAASPKDAAGDSLDSDIDPTGRTDIWALSDPGTYDPYSFSNASFDAGIYRSCPLSNNTIEGFVFADNNADGRFDVREAHASVGTVMAYDDTGAVVASTAVTPAGYILNVPDGVRVRLELTGLPADTTPGPAGPHSGSMVQFVTSPTCDAHFSVHRTVDYCESDPRVATSCFVKSTADQSLGAILDFPWLISDEIPPSVQDPLHNYPASAADVGTIYGLAWHRQSGTLFAGAFARSNANLPPDGLGAIYAVDPANGTSNLYINLADPAYFGPGYSGTIANPPPLDDPAIGRVGLGDLEVSPDGSTLWVVNNGTGRRELLQIPLAGYPSVPIPSAINNMPYPINQPDCANPDYTRGFALGFNPDPADDNVYLGVTCGDNNPAAPRVYVYAHTPGVPGFNLVLNEAMDWNFLSAQWDEGGNHPLLADIVFDQGDMILGIRNRAGDMKDDIFGPQPGELIRACPGGPGWVFEQNGTCGPRTTMGANNLEGPGGGEFYFGDASITFDPSSAHGSLALRPGGTELAVTTADNHHTGASGIRWFSAPTGAATRAYDIYRDTAPPGDFFGKGTGLGDVELLCSLPPFEAGNRVWLDEDGDGIQDPSEPPIAGVRVDLHRANGTFLASGRYRCQRQLRFRRR